jgi:hypothetical protein
MFAGLTDGDFDAYAPSKWRSNVYNRERLEVKQKLLTLARAVAPALVAADGSPLTVEASVEHPALWFHKQVDAQHVFFSRNEAARKELDRIIERGQSLASRIDDPTPQRNHMFLALSLSQDRLELALRLHPDARVDRQNLDRKCEDHFEREKLSQLLHALGSGFTVGVHGGDGSPAADVDGERIGALLSSFATPAPAMALPAAPVRFLEVVRALPRSEAVAVGPALEEQAQGALAALLAIYNFAAWTRDNDFVSMRDVLQREKQAKRQRGIARNDEVRVVRGMLAGKVGIVQEIDGRGAVRLLVGKMSVKVDAADLDSIKR